MNQLLLSVLGSSDRDLQHCIQLGRQTMGLGTQAEKVELDCIYTRPAPTCRTANKDSQHRRRNDLLAASATFCCIHASLVVGPILPASLSARPISSCS